MDANAETYLVVYRIGCSIHDLLQTVSQSNNFLFLDYNFAPGRDMSLCLCHLSALTQCQSPAAATVTAGRKAACVSEVFCMDPIADRQQEWNNP